MKLTNRYCLPEAYVRAVAADPYNNQGTLSVTTLIRPPWQVRLEREHWDELEEDVADRVWSLFGQAAHAALERTQQDGDIAEQRLFMDVDGTRVSGQLDRLTAGGVLVDWKFVSVYSVMDMVKNGVKPEYEQQLNLLAVLVGENGLPYPKSLRIIAFCRDFRPSEARRTDDYPSRVVSLYVPLWSPEKALSFLKERVAAHTDPDPIPCTNEERWFRPGKWAVMQKGKPKALRLLDTEDQAKEWMEQNGGDRIEERPATYPRCEAYCSVSGYCSIWRNNG